MGQPATVGTARANAGTPVNAETGPPASEIRSGSDQTAVGTDQTDPASTTTAALA